MWHLVTSFWNYRRGLSLANKIVNWIASCVSTSSNMVSNLGKDKCHESLMGVLFKKKLN
jgi:hypothetical protein